MALTRISIALFAPALMLSCAMFTGTDVPISAPPAEPAVAAPAAKAKPKNIILFIGDGMGTAHFELARFLRGAESHISTLPVIGLMGTRSADSLVPDSGATASSIATGFKTNNGMVSVLPSGERAETVLERADKQGKATGVLTTAAFWDATPAAFAAHAKDRDETANIVQQMLRSGLDVIAGGGLDALRKNAPMPLEQLAQLTGFTLADEPGELAAAQGRKLLVVLESQKNDVDVPGAPLPALTRKALEVLATDPDGLFLMVEHEGTDTSSHRNSAEDLSRSLQSFDEAVGVALEFAKRNPQTLVIVTADHETGALHLASGSDGAVEVRFSTMSHTAVAVPLYATGPGAEVFAGTYENTEVGRRLFALLGE